MFINAINPIKEIESGLPQLGVGYLISLLREKFGQEYIQFKVIDRDVEQEISQI